MKTFLKNYSWCIALATVLSLAGWGVIDWQFYAAAIAIILLEAWKTL